MLEITSTIAALMRLRSQRVRVAVEIYDASTPLRYCVGDDPITTGGDTYQPRAMALEAIILGDPDESRATLAIDDRDLTLRSWGYANGGFSERLVTVTELQWSDADHDWAVTRSWQFEVEDSGWSGGTYSLRLSGAVGLRPRAGLAVAGPRCCLNFSQGDTNTLCGYGGSDLVCSRTLDDCTAKGNQARFCGFVAAPVSGDSIRITSTTTVTWLQGYMEQPPEPGGADDRTGGPRSGGGRYAPSDPPDAPPPQDPTQPGGGGGVASS